MEDGLSAFQRAYECSFASVVGRQDIGEKGDAVRNLRDRRTW